MSVLFMILASSLPYWTGELQVETSTGSPAVTAHYHGDLKQQVTCYFHPPVYVCDTPERTYLFDYIVIVVSPDLTTVSAVSLVEGNDGTFSQTCFTKTTTVSEQSLRATFPYGATPDCTGIPMRFERAHHPTP